MRGELGVLLTGLTQNPMRRTFQSFFPGFLAVGLIVAMKAGSLYGQTGDSVRQSSASSSSGPEPLNWTTKQDHQNMMEQLGIKTLRPGPSGRAGATNAAN